MKRSSAVINGLFGAFVSVLVAAYAMGVRVAPDVPKETPARAPMLIVIDPSVAAGTTSVRAAVVGPSGGLMASTGYSASVTLGEPFVGTMLTSTLYTACVGFQCIGNHIPITSFAWLPITVRNFPALCDSFEYNDDRRTVAGGLVSSGTPYTAKLCAGDAEDNYRVHKSSSGNIGITITPPPGFQVIYFVYSASNFTTALGTCSNAGVPSATTINGTCTGLSAGAYVLRIYADPYGASNLSTYSFSITY